jgi:hypothetical protein
LQAAACTAGETSTGPGIMSSGRAASAIELGA